MKGILTIQGVVTQNMDELGGEIIDQRALNPSESEILCGLDDGQKFNKIGLILKSKSIQESEEENTTRTTRYEELFKNKFKESGVKLYFW